MPGAGMSVKCLPAGMLDCFGSCSKGPEFGTKRMVEIGATRGFDGDERGIGIGTNDKVKICLSASTLARCNECKTGG